MKLCCLYLLKCDWDDITCFLQQWLYTFYTCWLEFCYSNDSTTRWPIILVRAIKMSTWFFVSKSGLIPGKSFNQISRFYLPTCKIFFVRKHKSYITTTFSYLSREAYTIEFNSAFGLFSNFFDLHWMLYLRKIKPIS